MKKVSSNIQRYSNFVGFVTKRVFDMLRAFVFIALFTSAVSLAGGPYRGKPAKSVVTVKGKTVAPPVPVAKTTFEDELGVLPPIGFWDPLRESMGA